MEDIKKEYTNGEVTVVWKPNLCTHATFCWKELPEVFDPQKRPWVSINGANTERIVKQVKRCPSGALSFYMNAEKPETKKDGDCGIEVEVIKNGPLVISSCINVKRAGMEDEKKTEGAAFCRCGKSKNEPYCDGSHLNAPFEK